MYIIIVGAGNVGYGLALELYGNTDYEVLLVERQRQRALLLREELGELVVEGDGTEVTFLERIGARRADLVIAVTGDDAHNLVACQVARHYFGIGRTIARVNNPRNERLFQLVKLRASGLEVVDLHVQEDASAAGVALRDLELPERTTISLVISGEGANVPDGDTVLRPGDEIIAIIDQQAEPEMRALVSAPLPPGAEPREPSP